MLFTSATQFAVLALCLVAGWIFGLASTSGGRRWRDKHRAEEAEYAAYRKDAEARIAAAETRAATAENRTRELEAAQERARQVTAIPGQPLPGLAGARVAATTRRPVATDAAVPAAAAAGAGAGAGTGWRGWFGGSRDDLTLIQGVDESRARGLTDLGVRSYADIERMDADDEREVEDRLGVPPGTITSERWREQAAMLARGDTEGHRASFIR